MFENPGQSVASGESETRIKVAYRRLFRRNRFEMDDFMLLDFQVENFRSYHRSSFSSFGAGLQCHCVSDCYYCLLFWQS